MRNPFRSGGALSLWESRQKALTGSGGVVEAIETGWTAFPMLGSGSRDRISGIYNYAQNASYGWMYANSPAVRTVLDKIVRDVGELPLGLYEEGSDGERQPQPDHPAAMSLKYPNPNTTGDGLVRSLVKDFLIYDNAYALLLPGPSNQLIFARIPAFMVEIQGRSLFAVDNYRIWPGGAYTNGMSGGVGTPKDFTPDQIFHWHGEDPLDPRRGLSHLDTLRGVVAEDAALQQATVELANAGLQEPAWVFTPVEAPRMSNEARRLFEEDLNNRLRRSNSKPVVLEEGREMRSFGVSPRDAQMLEIRRWAVSQIASEYAMPGSKVGLEPASEQAESAYIVDVLKPLTKGLACFLDQRICVQVYADRDLCFAFSLDDRLMGDDRLRALTSASGRPVLLTNEARAMINRPPVDGGDELLTPMNEIVGDNPKPSSQVMPIQDPGKPAQDGSYRTDQPPPPQAPKAQSNGHVKAFEDQIPQYHPRRSSDIERQRKHIDATQAVVQGFFDDLASRLQRKAALPRRQDWERYTREFANDLDKSIRTIMAAEGTLYAFKLAGEFDPNLTVNYSKAMADRVARNLTNTVRGEIDELGAKDALARAPQHVASLGTSLGAAATMWAREEAARQSPNPESRVKQWISDTGRHANLDGTTVPLNADWPNGFAPGGEPGCACSLSIS